MLCWKDSIVSSEQNLTHQRLSLVKDQNSLKGRQPRLKGLTDPQNIVFAHNQSTEANPTVWPKGNRHQPELAAELGSAIPVVLGLCTWKRQDQGDK